MGRFSQSIKNSEKTDNHNASAAGKIELRQNVAKEIGAVRVFDAFAGSGEMWKSVWQYADVYIGCDKRYFIDERTAYVADNRRVMRSIDLGKFNVFDLDSYGSPWETALIVAGRRRILTGEKIGLVLTDGSGLKLKQGGIPNGLRIAAGICGNPAGLSREYDIILSAAIAGLCKRMKAKVLRRWELKGTTGAAVRYIGLIISGAAPPGAD